MKHIWYNPLASKGKSKKKAFKLYKKLKKTSEIKLHKIKNYDDFDNIVNETEEADDVILVGGDGALHYFVNALQNVDFKFKVYLCKAGSGNDFAREYKGKLIDITNEIKNLPYINYEKVKNGNIIKTKEYFINGMGSGIDAQVCYDQNNSKVKKSYFKIAVNAFKTFKSYDLNLTVDGKEYKYSNVWFCAIQNGKYFGGGMKIAPSAKRDDEYLDCYIITCPKRKKVVFLFPLIFFGKHIWAKSCVKYIKGKNFIMDIKNYNLLQLDGETRIYQNKIEISR